MDLEKWANEATALLDRMAGEIHRTKRFLERTKEDMEELAGRLKDLEDEHDRLVSNWTEKEGAA